MTWKCFLPALLLRLNHPEALGCTATDSLLLFKDKLVAQPLGEQSTSRQWKENLMSIPWTVAWAPSARSQHFPEQPIPGQGADLSQVHTSTFSVHYPNIMKARLCDPKIWKSHKRVRNKERGSNLAVSSCWILLLIPETPVGWHTDSSIQSNLKLLVLCDNVLFSLLA